MHKRNWEQDYADGRFDFLDEPHEQLRHAVISCLISRHAPGEVIDLKYSSPGAVITTFPVLSGTTISPTRVQGEG